MATKQIQISSKYLTDEEWAIFTWFIGRRQGAYLVEQGIRAVIKEDNPMVAQARKELNLEPKKAN